MSLLFYFFIIIPSVIIHEFAHAWMGYFLGDDTAQRAGRLTLNPLSHIDWFGTILLPVMFLLSGIPILFAYAKPVPFNPYNLRNQKYGPALVGLAGPSANLVVAIIFGLLVRFLPISNFTSLLSIVVQANLVLMIFNLLPVPPLDGSHLLEALLPHSWMSVRMAFERYGFVVLIFILFFGWQLIVPIVSFLFQVIVGGYPAGI